MRATAFLAVSGRNHCGAGLQQQVFQLQCLDQIGVPDEAAITDLDVGKAGHGVAQSRHALVERLLGAEHGSIALHDLLHFQAQARRAATAVGVTQAIEACHSGISRIGRQCAMCRAGLDHGSAMTGRLATEHHQVK